MPALHRAALGAKDLSYSLRPQETEPGQGTYIMEADRKFNGKEEYMKLKLKKKKKGIEVVSSLGVEVCKCRLDETKDATNIPKEV